MNSQLIAETKDTQTELKINSNIVLLVAIIGFIISILLYVFFIIIPLRRTEQKADILIDRLENASSQVVKVATDIENLLDEFREFKNNLEKKFEIFEEEACVSPTTFCQNEFSGIIQQEACETIVTSICKIVSG